MSGVLETILQHDNACPHIQYATEEALAKTEVLSQFHTLFTPSMLRLVLQRDIKVIITPV